MLSCAPCTRAVTATALFAALASGASAPACAGSLFGFEQIADASSTMFPTPPRHRTRRFIPEAVGYCPRDGGGNVFDYYVRALAANYASRVTIIAGVCASACTMKLGIQTVCVEPDATLLFHEATYSGVHSELGTRLMLSSYPPRIRQWALRAGALDGSSPTPLSGRQAIAMGMRSCRTIAARPKEMGLHKWEKSDRAFQGRRRKRSRA